MQEFIQGSSGLPLKAQPRSSISLPGAGVVFGEGDVTHDHDVGIIV